MTDQEINEAIAEARGWFRAMTTENAMRLPGGWGPVDVMRWFPPGANPDLVHGVVAVPDCANDLNAMHEAEKDAIEPYDILAYALHLNQILVRDWTPDRWNDFDAMGRNYAFSHATARQRAESFLRTLGKWKD